MTASRAAVILGSTGTLGTLQVQRLAADPTTHVVALAAAGRHLPAIAAQAVELGVYGLALREADIGAVNAALDEANAHAGADVRPEILTGADAAVQAASAGVDLVINAMTGPAGMAPSIGALKNGSHLAVANTETVVSFPRLALESTDLGGPLHGAVTLLNPDLDGFSSTVTEHAADIARVLLTSPAAPGAAARRSLRPRRVNQMTGFDVGIRLMEVRALTSAPIEVVAHAGAVSCLVELTDGRTILHRRRGSPSAWERAGDLRFESVDIPAVQLCHSAADEGGTYPAVAYAANEAAVAAHVDYALPLGEIVGVVARVLDAHDAPGEITAETVHEATMWAKERAGKVISSR